MPKPWRRRKRPKPKKLTPAEQIQLSALEEIRAKKAVMLDDTSILVRAGFESEEVKHLGELGILIEAIRTGPLTGAQKARIRELLGE